MSKKNAVMFLLAIAFVSMIYSMSLSELEQSVQDEVKEFIESNLDQDIDYISIEELEGVEYEILGNSEHYVIVIIDDEIHIVLKNQE